MKIRFMLVRMSADWQTEIERCPILFKRRGNPSDNRTGRVSAWSWRGRVGRWRQDRPRDEPVVIKAVLIADDAAETVASSPVFA